MLFMTLMFTTTLGLALPAPPPSTECRQTAVVTVEVIVRSGGGDPRRDRPEVDSNERRHPVAVFHDLVTRPLKRLAGGAR